MHFCVNMAVSHFAQAFPQQLSATAGRAARERLLRVRPWERAEPGFPALSETILDTESGIQILVSLHYNAQAISREHQFCNYFILSKI